MNQIRLKPVPTAPGRKNHSPRPEVSPNERPTFGLNALMRWGGYNVVERSLASRRVDAARVPSKRPAWAEPSGMGLAKLDQSRNRKRANTLGKARVGTEQG